jgi:predicted MFS family arabinose efflux permease
MVILMPACFTLSFGGTFRNAWASPYLTDTYGLQSISRGNALTAISVVGIVTAFAIPAMLKYVPARYVIAGFLLVGVVVSGALSILPDPGVGRSVGVIAALYAIGNIHPLVMTEAQAAIPEGRRGIGLGILNSLVFLGVSASSALFGQIMEMNNDTLSAYAWIFAATAVAVALAFLIYVMRTGFR